MPYSPEHKVETRARIVNCARRLFNRRGFTEVSIDEIMADAGLTRGGFYNHFSTKDELYAEAILDMVNNPPAETYDGNKIDFCASADVLSQGIIASYLSRSHLDDVEGGCVMIALPSDVARSGEPVKRAYQHALETIVGVFQASQAEKGDARKRAIAMATLCIGGMVLARAIDDDALRDEIRDAAMDHAFHTGGWDTGVTATAAE